MMTAPVPIPDTLIVHDGSFHADDVLVAAMLGELNPDLRVLRLGATQIGPHLHDPSSLVADVGGGRFDHHQPDAARREDGNKHAACGLVWDAFQDRLRPRDDEKAAIWSWQLMAIEDGDNGIDRDPAEQSPITDVVSCMNPEWDDDTPLDECFAKAASFVRESFVRPLLETDMTRGLEVPGADETMRRLGEVAEELRQRHRDAEIRATEEVEEAMRRSDGRLLVLGRYLPYAEAVDGWNRSHDEPIDRIIYPSNRGGFSLRAVNASPDSFELIRPLDREWLAKRPEGCTFVHQELFLACFDTLESAVAATEAERRAPAQEPEQAPPDAHAHA